MLRPAEDRRLIEIRPRKTNKTWSPVGGGGGRGRVGTRTSCPEMMYGRACSSTAQFALVIIQVNAVINSDLFGFCFSENIWI